MFLIKDKIKDSQQFPLEQFVTKIISTFYESEEVKWLLNKARGYGLDVCELEDKTLESDKVFIKSSDLLKIAQDPDQWFYDLDCFDNSKGLHFGILDSGGLFIDGNDEVIKDILAEFHEIQKVSSSR